MRGSAKRYGAKWSGSEKVIEKKILFERSLKTVLESKALLNATAQNRVAQKGDQKIYSFLTNR
jgi:hypothetical protein